MNENRYPNGRSTHEVLEDHLRCRRAGNLEEDLSRNYAPDVTTLSAEGVHHGHDAIRRLAGILRSYLPAGDYRYHSLLVSGQVGMLRWSGRCGDDPDRVHDGVDSYVVRDGHIVAQTIHYTADHEARQARRSTSTATSG